MVSDDISFIGRVLLIGDSGVGKTSLMQRWCDGEAPGQHLATIGVDFRIRNVPVNVDGVTKTTKLQIWDTAGQERFRSIINSYYRGAHGVILCYDMMNPESLESLEQHWKEEVNRYAPQNCELCIVGTKGDLLGAKNLNDESIFENTAGAILAKKIGARHFVTSASRGDTEAPFLYMADACTNTNLSRNAIRTKNKDSTKIGPGENVGGRNRWRLSSWCSIV